MKGIGGIVTLQACLNESFDKDLFMISLMEQAKSIKTSLQQKK